MGDGTRNPWTGEPDSRARPMVVPRRQRSIWDWQQRLKAQPHVYWVRDHRDFGEPGSVYDTREAAKVELEWRLARGERKLSIMSVPIHNLELSEERWGATGE